MPTRAPAGCGAAGTSGPLAASSNPWRPAVAQVAPILEQLRAGRGAGLRSQDQTLSNLRCERRPRRRRRGRSSGSRGAGAPGPSDRSRLPQPRPEDRASASSRPPRGWRVDAVGGGVGQRPESRGRKAEALPIRIVGGERALQFGEGESQTLSVPSSSHCSEQTGVGRLSPSCRDDSSDRGQGPPLLRPLHPHPPVPGFEAGPERSTPLFPTRLCPGEEGLSFHTRE